MRLEIDDYCFACGRENPIGLKLRFESAADGVSAEFTPCREHQGFIGLVHGGIITTLLDEAMAHAIIAGGFRAVTARMELSFKQPLLIGNRAVVLGKVDEQRGKLIKATAEIRQNDRVVAKASADFLMLKD
jgi:acyl-coenzyme A thioesterase PaaI-like protein